MLKMMQLINIIIANQVDITLSLVIFFSIFVIFEDVKLGLYWVGVIVSVQMFTNLISIM